STGELPGTPISLTEFGRSNMIRSPRGSPKQSQGPTSKPATNRHTWRSPYEPCRTSPQVSPPQLWEAACPLVVPDSNGTLLPKCSIAGKDYCVRKEARKG